MSRRLVAAANRLVCTGRFLRKSLSLQHVAKNQIRQNLCELLRRQNSLQRQIFIPKSPVHTKPFVPAMRRCNYSPDLHTKSDLSPRLVARTHPLVCFDPYALSVTRAHEISYSWFASTCQGGHVGDNTINNFLKSLRENSFSFPDGGREVTCKLAIRY